MSGRGQYRLCPTSILEWSKMRPEQRKKIIADFHSSSLRSETKVETNVISPLLGKPANTTFCLSVDAEDSGIETLPLVTLQGMWEKACKLLTMSNGITAALGDDEKARMVSSFSGKTPHFVSSNPLVSTFVTPVVFNGTLPKYAVILLLSLKPMES